MKSGWNHTAITLEFAEAKKIQSLKFTNHSQISSEKITEFLTKFHTVDNDKLMMRNHILPLT